MFASLALVGTHFVWAPAGGHAHGAIVVPVTIEGARHGAFIQLDTGAPYNFIYVEAAQNLGLRVHVKKLGSAQEPDCTNAFVPMAFTVAFHRERTLACAISYSGGSPIVGTLGLTALTDRILVIDFPEQRLAFSSDERVLEHAARTPFSAVANPRNTHVRGSAWSKPVDIVCAPTALDFQIVGEAFAHVTACTVVSGPPSAFTQDGIDAVIGNALFEKQTVILDFKNHRFGLMP